MSYEWPLHLLPSVSGEDEGAFFCLQLGRRPHLGEESEYAMKSKHGFFTSLKCRECGRHYPKEALHVCEFCFGPLEVDYDYELIGTVLTRERILSRPTSMWRYRELLPIDGEPTV